MPEVILPCPACGADSYSIQIIYDQNNNFWDECCECEMRGPRCPTRESAIAAWNALPRMSTIIAWQLQAAGAALENQRLRAALYACRCAIQLKLDFSSRKNEPELVDALEQAHAAIGER